MIPRAVRAIFDQIKSAASAQAGEPSEFLLRMSFLEIYNEELKGPSRVFSAC